MGGAGAGKGEGSGDDGREMAGSGTRHRGEGSFGVEEGRGEEGTGEAGLEGDENGDDLIAELMAAEGAEEDAAPEAITRVSGASAAVDEEDAAFCLS